MGGFLRFQQKVVDSRTGGGISGSLRLGTFEDKAELRASRTTVFLTPSRVVRWMLKENMTVKKKSDRNNKRMEIFILDRFVNKTRPIIRLAFRDVVDIEQRT